MIADFKKKRKNNPLKPLLLVGGVLLIFLVSGFLIVANVKIYKKRQELNLQVKNLEATIEELKQKNSNLEQGISNASEVSYMEKVAREELDLQKPGETVVSFVKPESSAESNAPPKKNVLESWMGWFSGWFK